MTRPTRALIDLAALRHNFTRVGACAPSSRVMAVVKADAYGHGLEAVAGALPGADAFGVASLEEALRLRGAGIDRRIVLLEGFYASDEIPAIAGHGLEMVVHHAGQLEALEAAPPAVPVRVWLKLDTGMHRLGFRVEEARAAWQRLRACPNIFPDIRLMTHLACADDRSDSRTRDQVESFRAARSDLPCESSIANSAGVLGWPVAHGDWVRPGIMLYGISPFMESTAADDGLRPVMTLETRLLAVNRCRKGESVGYGASWRCPEDMPVGVAAIGYGDGYPRHAPAGTPVLLGAERVPLIGRVSMDMLTLDLRAQPRASAGDPVVLWGRGLPAEEIARHAGTIAYELVCGVTGRVPRETVKRRP